MRQHRRWVQLGAAAFAAVLWACGSETVVRPEPQASSVGSQGGLSLGADTAITVGDTAWFQVISAGGTPVPSPTIRWASSEPLVAGVLADGRVVGLQLGVAVITAQVGSQSLSRSVTVALPGGRIVFRTGTPQTGLYSVRPDGTGRFQVYAPVWGAAYSDVSPDGRWVVHASNSPGRVAVQPVDGSEWRILFDPGWGASVAGVSWSPVGDRIVFAAKSGAAGDLYQLYVADTAGTSVTQITSGPVEAAFPAWSPDGTRIAFSTMGGNRNVWIVNADGTNPVMVPGEVSETHPAWISNTRLVIARGTVDPPYDLYLVNTDGSNLVQLTSDPGSEGWPHPSPDRRWVVFWTGSWSLSVIRVDGLGPFNVPTATSGAPFPSWGREPGPVSSVGSESGFSLGADTMITVGDTARFQVVNTHGEPLRSSAIQWASSAPQVAGALAEGRVVGLQLGVAVITAQVGSQSLARNVTVALPGGRIVFGSGTPQLGLYGVRPDGTGRFQIAAPSWAAYSDLSPDGRWIVYAGGGPPLGRALVGVQPIGGSETRILYDQPGAPAGVSWSPVGDRIVFAARSLAAGDIFQLYVADTAGASVTQITSGPVEAAFPAWSPDGTRIAFSTMGGNRNVWIVNADGTNPVMVPGEVSETHPAWISNTRLVIARGTVNPPYDLYLVNTDGSNLVQLTSDPGPEGWPHPSPDRRWVVFWTGSWTGSWSLSVIRVDGLGPFHIPTATSGVPFPSWGREP